MAKKTTVARRRTARIDTIDDLRAWLVPQFPKGWECRISGRFFDSNSEHGRYTNASFELSVDCEDWNFNARASAGSPLELASEFQATIAPKIAAERERRTKNQHLPRLGHEPHEQLVFTNRGAR